MKAAGKKRAAHGPLGVIDVGAHSARLEISQFGRNGERETLENLSQPVPLGADVFGNGRIRGNNINSVGRILRDFSRLMADYGVEHCKAFATSAVREAENRDIFLDRVRLISGIELEVLETPEEARIIFQAVCRQLERHVDISHINAVICTVGSGATQISFVKDGHLCSAETIRLGTLRVVEEVGVGLSSAHIREVIDPFVAAIINWVARITPGMRPEYFIAVGSSVRALTDIAGCREPWEDVRVISRSAFRDVLLETSGVPVAELLSRYHLDDATASGLQPCCNMLEHLFEITEAEEIFVPMINTRDAVVADFVGEVAGRQDSFESEIIASARYCAERYAYDGEHAEAVARMALRLFDELEHLHGLGERERLLLRVAAILHDIGMFVSNRQHHKHSFYLIRNTELPGVLPQEQSLIAVIARYHRRALPRTSHVEYMTLLPEQRLLVSKLAAILRVADVLDRSHSEKLHIARVTTQGDKLTIAVKGNTDLNLERRALERKADLFEDVYGLKVVLTVTK